MGKYGKMMGKHGQKLKAHWDGVDVNEAILEENMELGWDRWATALELQDSHALLIFTNIHKLSHQLGISTHRAGQL